MKRKCLIVLFAIIFSFMFDSQTVLASFHDNQLIYSNYNSQINSLLDYRAELICLNKYDELELVDQQLANLGVEKITSKEVQEKFYENPFITPYVTTPVSNNATWLSRRESWTYNGIKYEVQTLISQPKNNNSNLIQKGNCSVSSTSPFQAGFMSLVSTVAYGTIGKIPGASSLLSVYDGAKDFLSAISSTTEISKADVLYSYSHTTTVSFKYVKVNGQSDDHQRLSYISSKGTTAVGYMFPSFVFSGGSVTPNVIQGNRTINATPTGYDNIANAVQAYVNPYSASRNYLLYVTITGLESKNVSTIYPICPEFPSQIN